jgi:hypothetical protein
VPCVKLKTFHKDDFGSYCKHFKKHLHNINGGWNWGCHQVAYNNWVRKRGRRGGKRGGKEEEEEKRGKKEKKRKK